VQRTFFQLKRSTNCMQNVAQSEIDRCLLRIELKCYVLRGCEAGKSNECKQREKRRAQPAADQKTSAISYLMQ
jgi:hypothetical protein